MQRTSDKSMFPMALSSCGHRSTHQLRPINMNGRSILSETSDLHLHGGRLGARRRGSVRCAPAPLPDRRPWRYSGNDASTGQKSSSLGRSTENTFQLHDSTVSRRHAVISIDAAGTAWLTDLGSTNGTFVNGRRIAMQTPVQVGDGSRIQLGSSTLVKYLKLDPCEEGFRAICTSGQSATISRGSTIEATSSARSARSPS